MIVLERIGLEEKQEGRGFTAYHDLIETDLQAADCLQKTCEKEPWDEWMRTAIATIRTLLFRAYGTATKKMRWKASLSRSRMLYRAVGAESMKHAYMLCTESRHPFVSNREAAVVIVVIVGTYKDRRFAKMRMRQLVTNTCCPMEQSTALISFSANAGYRDFGIRGRK